MSVSNVSSNTAALIFARIFSENVKENSKDSFTFVSKRARGGKNSRGVVKFRGEEHEDGSSVNVVSLFSRNASLVSFRGFPSQGAN